MSVTITKSLEFDAGHRVLGHVGKCRYIHGHRYKAEITVQASMLNELGMVIDFSAIKEEIGEWIDQKWDHNILLNSADPILDLSKEDLGSILNGRVPYIMRNGNPTAENMAEELYYISQSLLPPEITIIKVKVFETPSCSAEFTKP